MVRIKGSILTGFFPLSFLFLVSVFFLLVRAVSMLIATVGFGFVVVVLCMLKN